MSLIVDTIFLFQKKYNIDNWKERQVNFKKKLEVGIMVIHPEKQ